MPKSDSKPNIFLQGKRVYLRPIETADIPRLQRWINDPGTRTSLASYLPFNEIAERKFVEQASDNKTAVNLAIMLKRGDRHIGSLELRSIRWKDRGCDFGIMIGEADCRGKGYGTEATALTLEYAFKTLNLNRVQLGVFTFNKAGIRAYEKAGFVREGVQREHNFVDGRYVDHAIYSILAREYFKRPPR